jgi:hypothetical protein
MIKAIAVFLLVAPAFAAAPKQTPAAPVPAQILTAKRVFIANAGGDSAWYPYPEPAFTGGPDRAYNDFYAAVKAWGRYDLVGSPSDADLLLEIQFRVLPRVVRIGATPYFDSQLRLTIRDPRTQAALWGIAEQVDPANLLGNRDKNFDQAMTRVLGDLKRVDATRPAPAASQ